MGHVVASWLVIASVAWHAICGCCPHRGAARLTGPDECLADGSPTCACGHTHRGSVQNSAAARTPSAPQQGDCPGGHHCADCEGVLALFKAGVNSTEFMPQDAAYLPAPEALVPSKGDFTVLANLSPNIRGSSVPQHLDCCVLRI